MRKLKLIEHISLDGVIQHGEDGDRVAVVLHAALPSEATTITRHGACFST